LRITRSLTRRAICNFRLSFIVSLPGFDHSLAQGIVTDNPATVVQVKQLPRAVRDAKNDLVLNSGVDAADLTEWLSLAATENGYGSPDYVVTPIWFAGAICIGSDPSRRRHSLSASLMPKRDGKTRGRLANSQMRPVNWNMSGVCLTAVARVPIITPARSHSGPEPGLNSCQRVSMGFQGKHGCRVVVIMASVTVSPD